MRRASPQISPPPGSNIIRNGSQSPSTILPTPPIINSSFDPWPPYQAPVIPAIPPPTNTYPLAIPPSILAAYDSTSYNPQDLYDNNNNNGNNFYNNLGNGYNNNAPTRGGPPPPPLNVAPYPTYGASSSNVPYYPLAPPPAPYGSSNFPVEHNNYPVLKPVTIDLPLVITYHTKISLSALNVLPPYFPSLELLPQINLATLPYSLETAMTQPPTLPGRRRKIFICPDLSPSAEPYNTARRIIGDDVEWREVPDLRAIERVLEDENRIWSSWLKRDKEDEIRRREEGRRGSDREENDLRQRALMSIGSNNLGNGNGNGVGGTTRNSGPSNRTGSISTTSNFPPVPLPKPKSETPNPDSPTKPHSEDLAARLASLVEAGIVKTSSSTQNSVGTFTPPIVVKTESTLDPLSPLITVETGVDADRRESEPSSASGRKRARFESEGLESTDEVESKRSPDRKLLDSICKRSRRDLEDWAVKNGAIIDEETIRSKNEPLLGEQDAKGTWRIGDEALGEVTPQIQILMARALRDSTVVARLRLYESPESTKILEENVPWFATLIKENQDRLDSAVQL